MLLFLASVTTGGQFRNFSCQIDELEHVFDFLSHIVGEGNTLVEAYIVEEGQWTPLALPLEAFDGSSFLEPIQSLEIEWRLALNHPVGEAIISHEELLGWIQYQVKHYESGMDSQLRMIHRYENWLQRTRDSFSIGPLRDSIIERYELTIFNHQQRLHKLQLCHQLVVVRLKELSAA